MLACIPETPFLIADRGYDPDWFRDALCRKDIAPCIPSKSNRKIAFTHDHAIYRDRRQIEIMLGRLKDWRSIHTR